MSLKQNIKLENTMKTSLLFRRAKDFLATRYWAAALTLSLFTGPLHGGEPSSGSTTWGSWNFDWEVKDGAALGIRNVYYKHKLVIYKANMPVIRVRYDPAFPCLLPGGAVLAFGDRINWSDVQPYVFLCSPPPGGKRYGYGTKFYQKSYTISGPSGSRKWLQIGVYAMLGAYRLHPGWQLSEDGYIKPFLGSAGIQCTGDHVHHAYWRIDFDVNGAASDQVFVRDQPGEWQKYTTEVNAAKNPATSRIWYVRNEPTGHGVWVFPGLNDGVKDAFSNLDVGPRLYKFPAEGVPWPGSYPSDVGELKYNVPAENIAEKDIVLWYVSHLRHHVTDRGCDWHVTGPTFKVHCPGEIR